MSKKKAGGKLSGAMGDVAAKRGAAMPKGFKNAGAAPSAAKAFPVRPHKSAK